MSNKTHNGFTLGLAKAAVLAQLVLVGARAFAGFGGWIFLFLGTGLLAGSFQVRNLASPKARKVQRTLLIIGAVCSVALTFGKLPPATAFILCAVFGAGISNTGVALQSIAGSFEPETGAFHLELGLAGLVLGAFFFLSPGILAVRIVLIALSAICFGCLVKLENYCLGIGLGEHTRIEGREAVFDGQRTIRFYSLFKMKLPRFFLILSMACAFSIGLMAAAVDYSPYLPAMMLCFAAGSLVFGLTRKVFSRAFVLLLSALGLLVFSLLLFNGINAVWVYGLQGLFLSGVLVSVCSYYVLACKSIEVLLGAPSPTLLCTTSAILSVLASGAGAVLASVTGLGTLWVLTGGILLFCFAFILIFIHAKMLNSETRLKEYLSSVEKNVVVREALVRELIRRPDAHKKPPMWLYFLAGLVIRQMCRSKYGMHVVKKCRIKGPALILTNHTSNFDYLYIASTCWPMRINFLATYYWFTFKKLRPWLRYMGVIQKYQFATDLTAMKKLKYVITEKHSTTFIAPEGTIYANGKSGYMSDSIVKIIKFLKVPVYSMKIEGAGLGHGKWQKVQQPETRVEISMAPLFTAEEVASLDKPTMYTRIVDALHFDDFEYQKRTGVQVRGTTRAEGLDDLLYHCPDCGKEFTLKTEGNRIFCTGCGLEARINDSYRFDWPQGKVWFDNYSQWFDYQYDLLYEQMKADPDFQMSSKVRYMIDVVDTDGYVDAGEGVITLSLRDGWTYRGTLLGKEVEEHDSLLSVPVAIMKMGVHFELPFKDGHSRCFRLVDDGRVSQKWHIASRVITEKILKK